MCNLGASDSHGAETIEGKPLYESKRVKTANYDGHTEEFFIKWTFHRQCCEMPNIFVNIAMKPRPLITK